MDALRQAYPTVDDVYLKVALDDADGDVVDALEMLLINIGEPSKGSNLKWPLTDSRLQYANVWWISKRKWLGATTARIEHESWSAWGMLAQDSNTKADDQTSALQTWISLRGLFPSTTFGVRVLPILSNRV